MLFGIAFEFGLCVVLCYAEPFQKVFGTDSLSFMHWCLPLPWFWYGHTQWLLLQQTAQHITAQRAPAPSRPMRAWRWLGPGPPWCASVLRFPTDPPLSRRVVFFVPPSICLPQRHRAVR